MTDQRSGAGDAQQANPESSPLVLIVDDSRVMRASLSRLLSKTYQVIETEDGQQGWEALQANPGIDLVFSDLSMPVVDGFELLRRVRSAEDAVINSVPFVVITGHEDDQGVQRKAAELGASDFVSKPFRSAEITTRAKTLIEQRHNVRDLRQELDERAADDAITGLANSAQFTTRFEQMLSLSRRHGLASACLLVQLEGFEQWASAQPTPEPDALLRLLADQLGDLVRVEDATAYLGEGRFALVLSGADRAGALTLAQRLGARWYALPENAPPMPELHIGISEPDREKDAGAGELLQAAAADLQALAREGLAEAIPAGAQPGQQAQVAALQQELEQARQSQHEAEQAEQSKSEQLRSLQTGARQQLAKAHQTINSLRTQLKALQARFREYSQRFSAAAQQQAETEIAQLRAVVAEQDKRLVDQQGLLRDAQQMVELLQAKLAEAQQHAEADKKRGFLSLLFRRG